MKIKCPNCGARLKVKLNTLNQDIDIPCPICKTTSPLKSYQQVTDVSQLEHTEYPDCGDNTKTGILLNETIGQIKILGSTLSPFQLKMGRNIIGRKANTSKADIQIPLQATKSRTSREHLIVDVEKVSGKGLVHYLSLYKSEVNETLLNEEKMEAPDRIILKHADVITLPEAKLVFEIPDVEGTII